MLISCLVLLLSLPLFYWLESRFLSGSTLPFAGGLPWVLALQSTMALGSLDGIRQGIVNRRQARGGPGVWKDGEVVQLEGTLSTVGAPLVCPLIRKPCAAYQYTVTAARQESDGQKGYAMLMGHDMAQTRLNSAQGPIALSGFPQLDQFPAENADGESWNEAAAEWISTRKWQFRDDVLNPALLLAKREAGPLPADIVLCAAREEWVEEQGSNTAAAVKKRMATSINAWAFRRLPVGEKVTVKGTWRSEPPRLEVENEGLSLRHEVKPGGIAENAKSAWTQTIVWCVFTIGGTAAFHYAVFAENGALWRKVIESVVLSGD